MIKFGRFPALVEYGFIHFFIRNMVFYIVFTKYNFVKFHFLFKLKYGLFRVLKYVSFFYIKKKWSKFL